MDDFTDPQQVAAATRKWFTFKRDDGRIHVLPFNDLRVHLEHDCWCGAGPDSERPVVIVHHSMDDRESYERGRKLQ